LNLEHSFAWPSTTLYLKALDLAETHRARLGSEGKGQTHQRGDFLMGITKVEVSGRLALACRGCGEIILLVGREWDWYEPAADGRPRSFVCSGCGALLTLADRVVGANARPPR
jgi:hypothetical protein